MNVNFGLFPPLDVGRTKKADRKKLYTDRRQGGPGEPGWPDFPPQSAIGEGDRAEQTPVGGCERSTAHLS